MKYENLEDRLVAFAANLIELVEQLPDTFAAKHLGKQLIRSGTSAALNYGEAQGAESKADFIHKMRITLKELKESYVCLKILFKKSHSEITFMHQMLKETNELISIFVASLKTAQKNR